MIILLKKSAKEFFYLIDLDLLNNSDIKKYMSQACFQKFIIRDFQFV